MICYFGCGRSQIICPPLSLVHLTLKFCQQIGDLGCQWSTKFKGCVMPSISRPCSAQAMERSWTSFVTTIDVLYCPLEVYPRLCSGVPQSPHCPFPSPLPTMCVCVMNVEKLLIRSPNESWLSWPSKCVFSHDLRGFFEPMTKQSVVRDHCYVL